jgi:hypothetical protein
MISAIINQKAWFQSYYRSPWWRSTLDNMNTWLHWQLTVPVIAIFLNFFLSCLLTTLR